MLPKSLKETVSKQKYHKKQTEAKKNQNKSSY